MSRRGASLAAALAALSLLAAGCGDDDEPSGSGEEGTTVTEQDAVVRAAEGDFNPAGIYERTAPGVVTVISVFGGGDILSGGAGQGSGFVVSREGEIVTNAHVVTSGGANNGGGRLRPARQVFVEFSDRNRVPAEIVGYDADADLALIEVDAEGLELSPLPVSDRDEYAVGEPVAAIGSPFGERQSLSIGIVSAIDRSIQSLSQFSIDNAIQTDASINPGNSGGPLIDADGEVIGVNQQIETTSGANSGVGFAIPATAIRFALEQLRESGDVAYAYLGVSTQALWPQLAEELEIPVDRGALIAEVVQGGPADEAGLEGGDERRNFQGAEVEAGGDVIVAVDGQPLQHDSDLAELVAQRRPGETVTLAIIRDGEAEEIEVELGPRPERVAQN